jgi:uncharacterized protein
MQDELEKDFTHYLRTEGGTEDGSHDIGHFTRVWHMCRRINAGEGGQGDLEVLLAASYFHDLVTVPKNHPDRGRSSTLSAEKAGQLLRNRFTGFPQHKIAAVQHAIEAHSFSAAIPARSMEAKVLQDADRMEALGAIGIARTFYTAGFMHSRMFHEEDPLGKERALDDRVYALDHFEVKLLRLPEMMQTVTGRAIAQAKALLLSDFRAEMLREILSADPGQ